MTDDPKKVSPPVRIPDVTAELEAASRATDVIPASERALTEFARLRSPISEFVARIDQNRQLLDIVDPLAKFRSSGVFDNLTSVVSATTRHQEAMRALLEPLSRISESGTALASHQATLRAAIGPLSDLQRSGALAMLKPSFTATFAAESAVSAYNKQFQLLKAPQLASLIAQAGALGDVSKVADFAKLASRMNTPWLDTHNLSGSLRAFADLQGIGASLKVEPPFGDSVTSMLRHNLGDWRDRITWPASVFGDLAVRSAFYVDRGFRPELTDFPADAFDQNLEMAELTDAAPTLVEQYGEPLPNAEGEDASDFERTNRARSWLTNFETQIRWFINERLTTAFGADWPKHRLPNGMHDEWLSKKNKAEKAGAKAHPLICYADFTDYERIICKRDIFVVFAPLFVTPESLRESLQRLYLPRIETAHSRPISFDDELLLYAELRRLRKVFWKN